MSDTSKYRVTKDTAFVDVDLDEEAIHRRDGRRLTDEIADEIVEQVTRGRGRPSLSDKSPTKQLAVRVTADLNERVRVRATREHKRPSEVIREALEHYV